MSSKRPDLKKKKIKYIRVILKLSFKEMVKWCSYESPHYQTLNKCQFYMLDKIFMIRSAFEILIKGKQKVVYPNKKKLVP